MKKISMQLLLFFYEIKINDKFLYIEPAYGYAEVKSIKFYSLISINYETDEFHLSNIDGDQRYLGIDKIVQLKASQNYLKRTLPNVPNREYERFC